MPESIEATIEVPNLPDSPPNATFLERLSSGARGFLERAGFELEKTPADVELRPPAPKEEGDNRVARRAKRAAERVKPQGPWRRLPSSRGRRAEVERLAARARERDERYLQRQRRKLGALGVAAAFLTLIPRNIWIMARDILADPSGQAARIWLRRERNKVACGCIRFAALVPGSDGTTRYTWADLRARRICALGLALVSLARPAPRRKGIWSSVLMGVPRGYLCALLADPYESKRRPSKSALAGTHRVGATLETGQLGYLRALERAGLFYRQQLPLRESELCERFGGDHPTNRYWLITSLPHTAGSSARRQQLVDLHEAGARAATERPRLAADRLAKGGFYQAQAP